MRYFKYLISYYLMLSNCGVFAVDLGVIAHSFIIQEQDFEDMLKSKLSLMTMSEWQLHEDNIKEKVRQNVNRPKAVNIPNASKYRRCTFDPTVTLHKDIYCPKGNLLLAKGHRANPLDSITIRKPLLFIDGDNQKHISWALEQHGIWVLIKGSPLELEKQCNHAVYFDQAGKLAEKFGIQQIPAKVYQLGKELVIEEFVL